jgi:hypothetical protein
MSQNAAKPVNFGEGWSAAPQEMPLPFYRDKLPELLGRGVFQKQSGLKAAAESTQKALVSLVDSPQRGAAVIINGAARPERSWTEAGTYFVPHLDWEELLTYLRAPEPNVTQKENGQCIRFGDICVGLPCLEVTKGGSPGSSSSHGVQDA